MKFIRFKNYDNSLRVRDIHFMKDSTSCWAVPDELADEFIKTYWDSEPEVIDVKDKLIFAYDYDLVDQYVTSTYESISIPLPVFFDGSIHVVKCERKSHKSYFSFCDYSEDEYVPNTHHYFTTPFQVVLKNKDNEDALLYVKNIEDNKSNTLVKWLLETVYGFEGDFEKTIKGFRKFGYWDIVLFTNSQILVDGIPMYSKDQLFEYIEDNDLENDDKIKFTFCLSYNRSEVVDEIMVEDLLED